MVLYSSFFGHFIAFRLIEKNLRFENWSRLIKSFFSDCLESVVTILILSRHMLSKTSIYFLKFCQEFLQQNQTKRDVK